MRYVVALLVGLLLGHLVWHAREQSTVPPVFRVVVPAANPRDAGMGVQQQLGPSAGQFDFGASSEVVEQVQGGAVSAVGWGDAAEPALSAQRGGGREADGAVLLRRWAMSPVGSNPTLPATLTAPEITALALRVTADAAFAAWAGPVGWCESLGRATALGAALEVGLLQLHPVWRDLVAEHGYLWAELEIPAINIEIAYEIWRTAGPDEWACS